MEAGGSLGRSCLPARSALVWRWGAEPVAGWMDAAAACQSENRRDFPAAAGLGAAVVGQDAAVASVAYVGCVVEAVAGTSGLAAQTVQTLQEKKLRDFLS